MLGFPRTGSLTKEFVRSDWESDQLVATECLRSKGMQDDRVRSPQRSPAHTDGGRSRYW
jgi:hypothetical protein